MPKIGEAALAAHDTTHENGGSDEISVAGLSGALADSQTPSAHNTTHQNGGSDEISVAGLSGVLAQGQTPAAHGSAHENGGADEISVAGLSGVLADPQTPIGSLIGESRIVIMPWVYSQIIQGTWSAYISAAQLLNGAWVNTSNAQNDQVDYTIYLAAGTYNFSRMGILADNQAIFTLLIDGVSAGTIDCYSASTVNNSRAEITGIVIPSSGFKTISFKAATRNASSVGWYLNTSVSTLYRTA